MGERDFHLHGNSFNRRAIGTEYETLACEYLTRHGYQILCRNFRCRQGEIDIIARDRDYLVFIEVKYRRDDHEGLRQGRLYSRGAQDRRNNCLPSARIKAAYRLR